MQGITVKSEILCAVKDAILIARPAIRREDIDEEASLVETLGMDSMHLSTLFTEIKRRIGKVDMTEWYVLAARGGADTVGGLVDYLEKKLANTSSFPNTMDVK